MTRTQFIISAAAYYIGKKEKPGNAGFYDAAFEKELTGAGWYKGAAWCAFFVKLILLKAYKSDARLLDVVRRMSNGGALMSLNNHKNNGTFKVGQVPVPGAIVVWKHGNGPSGHMGIVERVDGNTMTCIEGNTNASGSREGDQVARKLRTVSRPFSASGLNVAGYIYPVEI